MKTRKYRPTCTTIGAGLVLSIPRILVALPLYGQPEVSSINRGMSRSTEVTDAAGVEFDVTDDGGMISAYTATPQGGVGITGAGDGRHTGDRGYTITHT